MDSGSEGSGFETGFHERSTVYMVLVHAEYLEGQTFPLEWRRMITYRPNFKGNVIFELRVHLDWFFNCCAASVKHS
ncbi:hypothetical protein AVEN_105730-1 [Araneus ventricosus]|uniref:Uncharacterized protein n=1 Tax=Araneus ventricosus TaxID=182803 RepID=A0A4Y2IEL2_ARAVE|nr:hypothetical protein AVEN_105730-1 [Araneus ventricosus]